MNIKENICKTSDLSLQQVLLKYLNVNFWKKIGNFPRTIAGLFVLLPDICITHLLHQGTLNMAYMWLASGVSTRL